MSTKAPHTIACDNNNNRAHYSLAILRNVIHSVNKYTTKTHRRLGRIVVVTSVLFFCNNHNAMADNHADNAGEEFSRTIYAGAGLGVSRLEPNTAKIAGWDVNRRSDNGGQINLGIDLFRQLSVELHSTDLGSAGLSPTGHINYHIDGLSALVYAGGHRNRYKRQGLTAYGRGGFGLLSNSPAGAVPFRKVDANHLLWGAGVEYMHHNGLGARAEVISFSADAQYGQLGLIYRFGKKPTIATPDEEPSKQKLPAKTPKPSLAPPPPPPPPFKLTEQQSRKIENPCGDLKGVMDGVRFDSGSAHLTVAAKSILDDLAVTLSGCPQLPVIISAHTDSQGSERTNQILSQRRAWAVINYLRGIGVGLYRLIPRAFGETVPIDTNDTVEGRRNNRRVELIAR